VKKVILYPYRAGNGRNVQHLDEEVCTIQKRRGRYTKSLLLILLGAAAVAAGLYGCKADTYAAADGVRMPLRTAPEPAIIEEERIEVREEVYSAVLHCKVLRCFDPTLPAGTEQVLTEGRNGQLRCRAEVTYRNGQEQLRKVLEERVAVQPVDTVIAVGTGQGLSLPDLQALPEAGDGILKLPTGEVLTYSETITSLATAYCDKGLTATGTQARVGAIAVDPDCIPYGTRMFIVTLDGEYIYGIATAEDCGSKEYIHDTRIDLHFDTYAECRRFGARWCRVYILS